jgi:hypothetical protein
MPVPEPERERQRLAKAGREYYAQFMLACLVLGDRPPGWNVAAQPSDQGMRLLERIDPFPVGAMGRPDFYWEFRLAARHDGEDNGWPDLAAVWPERVLLFELKTEPGSVREGQVDRYLDLALHHFPSARVDLLYITRDRVPSVPPGLPARARYATTTWDLIADHIEATWADPPGPDGGAAQVFVQHLRTIITAGTRPDTSTGAPARGGRPAGADAGPPVGLGSSAVPGKQAAPDLDEALEVAAQVEADGRQRAYPYRWPSRDAAEGFRQQLTARLSEEARAGRPRIAHARPWVWVSSSTGRALGQAGEETGIELRFSYYK